MMGCIFENIIAESPTSEAAKEESVAKRKSKTKGLEIRK